MSWPGGPWTLSLPSASAATRAGDPTRGRVWGEPEPSPCHPVGLERGGAWPSPLEGAAGQQVRPTGCPGRWEGPRLIAQGQAPDNVPRPPQKGVWEPWRRGGRVPEWRPWGQRGVVRARAVEADGGEAGPPHPSLLGHLAAYPAPCPSALPGPTLGLQRDRVLLNPAGRRVAGGGWPGASGAWRWVLSLWEGPVSTVRVYVCVRVRVPAHLGTV